MSVFNDDVLLIHVPKCAGSSCRDYLLAHAPDMIDSIGPDGGPLPIDSVPLRHITEYTGRPLDSWQKIIAPIRNPYAHAVSHWSYHWDRYARGGRHLHDYTAAAHKTLTPWLQDEWSDFRLWYECAVRGVPVAEAMDTVSGCGFFEYYLTVDGAIPENVVVLDTDTISETFPAEVDAYCTSSAPFGHSNRSPHSGSKTPQYYTPLAVALVNHRYRWAFDHDYYQKG